MHSAKTYACAFSIERVFCSSFSTMNVKEIYIPIPQQVEEKSYNHLSRKRKKSTLYFRLCSPFSLKNGWWLSYTHAS